MQSDFWNSEMFNDLEYFWQTSLMQPVDGMDMIWKGFLPQETPSGTVESMIVYDTPVQSISRRPPLALMVTAVNGATVLGGLCDCHPIGTHFGTQLDGNFIDPIMREIIYL